MTARRFVVVGGGIAGLAAAHALVDGTRDDATPAAVVVLEAGPRAGGVLGTEYVDGFAIEQGPDTFLAEKPWMTALCTRLGIADRLIETKPGERRTYIVFDGRLHPLPEGFLMLAPTALWPLALSPLFTWRGKLRMALDLVLPRRHGGGDESLAAFVRRRLGEEALDRAADPLASGVYTADPEQLSIQSAMPRFVEMERQRRSLILALRANAQARSGSGARYALFQSHVRGMGALMDDIAAKLPPGVLRLNTPVDAIARDGDGWRVDAGGETFRADGVVVAAATRGTAKLLRPIDAPAADLLAAIPMASSVTVTFSFPSAAVGTLPGFGFVVPFIEHRKLLACTFASRKWEHRAPPGWELIRCFLGGVRQPELATLPDDELIAIARAELAELLHITVAPGLVRVMRYLDAMPQYTLGHAQRIATIEARVAAIPGLAIAGNAYHGVGVPDAVHSGERAAARLLGRATD